MLAFLCAYDFECTVVSTWRLVPACTGVYIRALETVILCFPCLFFSFPFKSMVNAKFSLCSICASLLRALVACVHWGLLGQHPLKSTYALRFPCAPIVHFLHALVVVCIEVYRVIIHWNLRMCYSRLVLYLCIFSLCSGGLCALGSRGTGVNID